MAAPAHLDSFQMCLAGVWQPLYICACTAKAVLCCFMFFFPSSKQPHSSRLALSSKFLPPRNLDKQNLLFALESPICILHRATFLSFTPLLVFLTAGVTLSFLWPFMIINRGFSFSFLSLLKKFLEPSLILRFKGRKILFVSALFLQGLQYPACDLTTA